MFEQHSWISIITAAHTHTHMHAHTRRETYARFIKVAQSQLDSYLFSLTFLCCSSTHSHKAKQSLLNTLPLQSVSSYVFVKINTLKCTLVRWFEIWMITSHSNSQWESPQQLTVLQQPRRPTISGCLGFFSHRHSESLHHASLHLVYVCFPTRSRQRGPASVAVYSRCVNVALHFLTSSATNPPSGKLMGTNGSPDTQITSRQRFLVLIFR